MNLKVFSLAVALFFGMLVSTSFADCHCRQPVRNVARAAVCVPVVATQHVVGVGRNVVVKAAKVTRRVAGVPVRVVRFVAR